MRKFKKKKKLTTFESKMSKYLINDKIKAIKVRLIDDNNENKGEVSLIEARKYATELGMDLVCLNPKDKVPICKILDYGKFRFEQQRKQKKFKKNQTKIIKKEYRIGILTSDYDLNYRKKKIIESLKKGYHVKISLKLHGRFLGIENAGVSILENLAENLKEFGDIDKKPTRVNKRYVDLYMIPNKKTLKILRENQKQKKMQRMIKENKKENDNSNDNDISLKVINEKNVTQKVKNEDSKESLV